MGAAEQLVKAARKLARRMEFQGLDISIETDKGQKRYWFDPHNNTEGSTTMEFPYGYIRRSPGDDGDLTDCVSISTDITMFDLTTKKAGELVVGDHLLGFEEEAVGRVRKTKKSIVENVLIKNGELIDLQLSDGRKLTTTPDHKLLVWRRGRYVWKCVSDLNLGDELCSLHEVDTAVENCKYMQGYLYGAYLGDGSVRLFSDKTNYADIRVLLTDKHVVDRVYRYWNILGVCSPPPRECNPQQTNSEIEPGRVIKSDKMMYGLCIRRSEALNVCKDVLLTTFADNKDWARGFLAGIIDTDGHVGRKRSSIQIIQVKNQDRTFSLIRAAYKTVNSVGITGKGKNYISLKKGNGPKNLFGLHFLHKLNLSLLRKKQMAEMSVRFQNPKIVSFSATNGLYAVIQTSTKTYISNGIASHNCYVGPNKDADKVYVIDQMSAPEYTKHDEFKVMLGFDSAEEAKSAYLRHYTSPKFFGSMETMSMDGFKDEFVNKSLGKAFPNMPQQPQFSFDLDVPENVDHWLNNIGGLKDKDLQQLSAEAFGEGYKYIRISQDQIRAELRGFLQDLQHAYTLSPPVPQQQDNQVAAPPQISE